MEYFSCRQHGEFGRGRCSKQGCCKTWLDEQQVCKRQVCSISCELWTWLSNDCHYTNVFTVRVKEGNNGVAAFHNVGKGCILFLSLFPVADKSFSVFQLAFFLIEHPHSRVSMYVRILFLKFIHRKRIQCKLLDTCIDSFLIYIVPMPSGTNRNDKFYFESNKMLLIT